MSPQQFITKWQRVQLRERSASQQHFLDLCELLDQPKPAAADPQIGAHYTSRQDIADLVEPVVMAPLRREWADVQAGCEKLAAEASAARKAVRATRVTLSALFPWTVCSLRPLIP